MSIENSITNLFNTESQKIQKLNSFVQYDGSVHIQPNLFPLTPFFCDLNNFVWAF